MQQVCVCHQRPVQEEQHLNDVTGKPPLTRQCEPVCVSVCVTGQVGCVTFMSPMTVWKSPPSALHSRSITASILAERTPGSGASGVHK